MRKILLIFVGFLLSISTFAQTELVIEVKTDAYPEETNWTLFDLERNLIQESIEMDKETVYRDTIVLEDANCYYWTIYDAYAEGMNGPKPGDYKLYVDGVMVDECEDPNFGDSVSVYNLGKACTANDINVVEVAFLDYISKDALDIPVNVINMGTDIITSLEVAYSVNGVASSVATVDGLSIEVGELAKVNHPDSYDFATAGDYTIEYTVSKVNGVSNSIIANSPVTKVVTVVDGYVKMNMMEDIMSYDCGPCWDADVVLKGTLPPYDGTYILMKYMSWDWCDTKYFPEIEDLSDYYSVMGVPNITLNGDRINWQSFTPIYYEDFLGIATPVKITVSGSIEGDMMNVNAKVLSNIDITDELALRGIVYEKECFDVRLGQDNSIPFENVAYGFVDKFEAALINGIKANEEYEFSSTISIAGYSFEEGSFEDMALTFYVQNKGTREILQAEMTDVSYEPLPIELTYSIEHGATNVDTVGLVATISSNRKMLDIDGNEIIIADNIVTLRQDGLTGPKVPFISSIDSTKMVITVVPKYGWMKGTNYCIVTESITTIDGEILSLDTLSFTTKDYVGIEDLLFDKVQVYPNPVKNNLTIVTENIATVHIFDIAGKQLHEVINIQGNYNVDMTQYNTGVYLIEVKIKGLTKTYKILK